MHSGDQQHRSTVDVRHDSSTVVEPLRYLNFRQLAKWFDLLAGIRGRRTSKPQTRGSANRQQKYTTTSDVAANRNHLMIVGPN